MSQTPWPQARAINLLPRDDGELARLSDALGDRLFAGVIVKNLSDEAAEARTRDWAARGAAVSVGMGDGDDTQWLRALNVAARAGARHLNQPWFAAGRAVGALRAAGAGTLVNALVSPVDGEHGRVVLSPGGEAVILRWADLVPNLEELGIASVKFFPMGGDEGHVAYSALVRHLGKAGRGGCAVEPSGGITPAHLDWLYGEGADAGVTVIPHIYGALRSADGAIDPAALDTIQSALSPTLSAS